MTEVESRISRKEFDVRSEKATKDIQGEEFKSLTSVYDMAEHCCIEEALDEADSVAENTTLRLSHDEVFTMLRNILL